MKLLGEFRRRGDLVERRFTSAERRMLGNLSRQSVAVLESADELAAYDDPVLRRLLPVAFPDDPDEAAEFAAATRARLAASKAQGARRLETDLAAAPNGVLRLDRDGALVWLKALGDLRMSIAERVGVEELHRDVSTPHGLLYAWLTWLQGSLVEAVDD